MEAQLLVVQGRPHGKCLTFPHGEWVFGRGLECHVRPDSPSVSRQHCLLRVEATHVLIRDLGSTNGTLVNGTRVVSERTLTDGDLIQIGPLVLQLRLPREHTHTPPGMLSTLVGATEATQILPPGFVPQDEATSVMPEPLEKTGPAPTP